MQASAVLQMAEELLLAYRELLLIDPFYKITVDTSEGTKPSMCLQEGPLAWKIKLDVARHADHIDVKYSIVDGLLRVMFANADRVVKNDLAYQESRDEIVVRLTTVLCTLLPDYFSSDTGIESAEESLDVSN